jgi:(p)ppGpp synthase/HD superfamily hydrolase
VKIVLIKATALLQGKVLAVIKEKNIPFLIVAAPPDFSKFLADQKTSKVNDMRKGEMLASMLVIATNAHAGQFDKGGYPYILHPLKVMHYTKSSDEEIQCIALGHDVIEDTDVTYKDLREAGMSERVIEAINVLTKQPGQTLEEYKARVFSNPDAMIVKSADLRHNSDLRRLKGVSEKDFARIAKYMLFFAEITSKLQEKSTKSDA